MSASKKPSGKSSIRKQDRLRRQAKRRPRPVLEFLEKRVVLSTYIVTNASADVSTTGSLGYEIAEAITEADTNAMIRFDSTLAGRTISLVSTPSNPITTYGPTAYVISGSGVNLTIDGSDAPGLTINANHAIRPFAVASGASLTLEDLTVTNGVSQGEPGVYAETGGAGGGGRGWVERSSTRGRSRPTASPSPTIPRRAGMAAARRREAAGPAVLEAASEPPEEAPAEPLRVRASLIPARAATLAWEVGAVGLCPISRGNPAQAEPVVMEDLAAEAEAGEATDNSEVAATAVP